jgi:hypothetical protein
MGFQPTNTPRIGGKPYTRSILPSFNPSSLGRGTSGNAGENNWAPDPCYNHSKGVVCV